MLRRLGVLGVAALAAAGVVLGALALARDDAGSPPRRVVVVADTGTNPSADKWVDVFCPRGFTVVGGGGPDPHGNDTPQVALYWSAPYRNGWLAAAQDGARRRFPWNLQVTAICLEGVHDAPSSGGSLPPTTFSPSG